MCSISWRLHLFLSKFDLDNLRRRHVRLHMKIFLSSENLRFVGEIVRSLRSRFPHARSCTPCSAQSAGWKAAFDGLLPTLLSAEYVRVCDVAILSLTHSESNSKTHGPSECHRLSPASAPAYESFRRSTQSLPPVSLDVLPIKDMTKCCYESRKASHQISSFQLTKFLEALSNGTLFPSAQYAHLPKIGAFGSPPAAKPTKTSREPLVLHCERPY